MGSLIGATKTAAHRAGISLSEYLSLNEKGLKRCFACGKWLYFSNYAIDRSRGDGLSASCKDCRNYISRQNYQPVPTEMRQPAGPQRIPRRDGDVTQANSRINHDVRQGLRPNPNNLHCAKCGHKGPDRRHEYHHHMGYQATHHYDVLPLCTCCHHEEHK